MEGLPSQDWFVNNSIKSSEEGYRRPRPPASISLSVGVLTNNCSNEGEYWI